MRLSCVIFTLACSATTVCAQSATIRVAHDDSDGIVSPGESVTISLRIEHLGFLMVGRWRGDVLPQPNMGVAHSPAWGVPIAALNGVTPGTVVGGGIQDALFYATSPFFTPEPPFPWIIPDFEFMRYTWIAPATPGAYAFNWTPHPQFPVVEGYASGLSIPLTPYPTTYVGTSLTVIPAAPSACVLAVVAGVVGARRRR